VPVTLPLAVAGCPKRMRFGPCGGVRADLGCEMTPSLRCAFAGLEDAVPWDGARAPAPAPVPMALRARTGPLVLTDYTATPYDATSLAAVTGTLAGSCDAVLVGEHQNRPDFPPALMARLIEDAGARPWITLTCRDRNRIVLEQELAALAYTGVAGVLCVTGDGRAQDVRPDVTQVFDLDSTRLTALAAASGVPLVAVAESPLAPPAGIRAARVRQKQLAGAGVCVLNHVRNPRQVADFAAALDRAGATVPLVAAVAVYTDERSARVFDLPGLELDGTQVERVLAAADPVAAGIAAAVAEARALLAVPGVAGVNLSGLASGRDLVFAAEVKAEVGRQVRELGAGNR
jgi:methylenetetrahydrofolate reductase (NADPH)